MIRLQRGYPPEFWTKERVRQWTRNWMEKRSKKRPWNWPQYQGKPINQYAITAMLPWHYRKCAFCEAPLFSGVHVEHFRSKAKFPLAAFVWRNLFLCCQVCNEGKRSLSHEGCIKPDREDPADYLWVDPIFLKVIPKDGISKVARQRALKTIQLYALDRPELNALYKEYLNLVSDKPLSTVANETRPFSLMIKSLLAYQQTTLENESR